MKKTIALLAALTMALGCLPAMAENAKHERVYVVTAADGTVQSITDSVRLENADHLDEIRDQTRLSAIQNVGGEEAFTLDGEALTWQAKGKDIVYQGTSDRTPALLPAAELTLDGEKVSFADLKNKTGDAVLTVSYPQQEQLPVLAVTVIPLPEKGVTELKLENASLISEMGRQLLVGWAVPGADEALGLPASFTASFRADHADLSWMMTLATSDPVETAFGELEKNVRFDMRSGLDETKLLLTALKNGEPLPETTGITKLIAAKINELNDGLTQLNDGAASLADGTAQLSSGASELKDGAAALKDGAAQLSSGTADAQSGAAALDEGLNALTANSQALNAGAEKLFAAVLDTANRQLAAAGLDKAGLTLPELTADNYSAVLEGVTTQLSQLLQQSTDSHEAADRTAAAHLAQAQAALESLSALKEQLDQTHAFVEGLQAYTAGTAQAAAGASALHAGLTQLNAGAAALSDGAATLNTGVLSLSEGASQVSGGAAQLNAGTKKLKVSLLGAEKKAAGTLLPLAEGKLTDALQIYEATRDSLTNNGYDLRPEGMKATTVYIIRTDLQ